MANYFVNGSTGSNSNNGTSSGTAWLTVQKAADTMVAGDTVTVAAGTYLEVVTETTNGSSGNPISYVASGTVTIDQFAVSGDYVNVTGFSMDLTRVNPNEFGIYMLNGASFCTFTNCIMTGSGIFVGGAGGIGFASQNVTDCLFTGCTITNPDYHACALAGLRNIVEDCAITVNQGWDIFRVVGSDITIRGNTIDADNVGVNENHADIIQSFGDGADVVQNVIFEDNFIVNGSTYQFGNITDDLENGDISGWIFRNNILMNVSNALNLYAPDFTFINNTFYRCGVNSNWVIIWGVSGAGAANNTVLKNNIFFECGTATLANRGWYAGDPITGLVGNYNLVIGTGAGTTKDSSWNTGGLEANGINGQDPLFMNAAAGDFNLQPGSPAIDAGEGGVDIGATGFAPPSGGGGIATLTVSTLVCSNLIVG